MGQLQLRVVGIVGEERLGGFERRPVPSLGAGELELRLQGPRVVRRRLERLLDVLHRGDVELLGPQVGARQRRSPGPAASGRRPSWPRSPCRAGSPRAPYPGAGRRCPRSGSARGGRAPCGGGGRSCPGQKLSPTSTARSASSGWFDPVEYHARLVEPFGDLRSVGDERVLVALHVGEERLQPVGLAPAVRAALGFLRRGEEPSGLLDVRGRRFPARRVGCRPAFGSTGHPVPPINRFGARGTVPREGPRFIEGRGLPGRRCGRAAGTPQDDLRPGARRHRPGRGLARPRRPPRVPAALGDPADWARPPRLPRGEPHASRALPRGLRRRPHDGRATWARRRVVGPRRRGRTLHDLGHTPLSHTLEPTLREVTGAGHEARSRAVISGDADSLLGAGTGPSVAELLEKHGIVPRSVGDLVDPTGRSPPPLLRAILHGAIDADRIDYLQRDAYYTGVAHGTIDAARLLDTVRATRSRLVFAEKGRQAVEGFLVGRALMYSSVYYHKTVRAAEVMAQAAVERLPGYPGTARPLLEGTDGDLLVALQSPGAGRPRWESGCWSAGSTSGSSAGNASPRPSGTGSASSSAARSNGAPGRTRSPTGSGPRPGRCCSTSRGWMPANRAAPTGPRSACPRMGGWSTRSARRACGGRSPSVRRASGPRRSTSTRASARWRNAGSDAARPPCSEAPLPATVRTRGSGSTVDPPPASPKAARSGPGRTPKASGRPSTSPASTGLRSGRTGRMTTVHDPRSSSGSGRGCSRRPSRPRRRPVRSPE